MTDKSKIRERVKKPTLNIMIGNTHVATLFHDGSDFCLVYKPEFLTSGLAPFNLEDLKPTERPIIDHCYRSKVLWHTFAERLPREDRPDTMALLKELGLSLDTDPLIILGKIGSVSISKPWRLVLGSLKGASR